MKPEPTDAEVIRAAVNALTAEAELRTKPDQKREKGQSAFRRAFVEWAEANKEQCYSTQFFSQAIRDRRIGVVAANVIRRFYGLTAEVFVGRFGKDVESAARALRISRPTETNGLPRDLAGAVHMNDHVASLAGESKSARVGSARKKPRRR